jgi:1-acyl-sn-glycerol-3-phosphate acyltransferase
MQFIRSAAFDLFACAWTLALSPSAIVLWLRGTPHGALRNVAQLWLKGLIWGLWHIVGLRHTERGRKNIPNVPCIVIANHQSAWETLILATIFPTAAFVAKRETSRIPVIGWFLRNYPMIMIDRGGGSTAIRQLITESRATLADGRSVIIFPEGTRKTVSDPILFKRGIEFLYSEIDAPVLPIALNSGVFWGRHRLMKYDGTIALSFLPPIQPGLSRDEFRQTAQALLEAERDRLVGEATSNHR